MAALLACAVFLFTVLLMVQPVVARVGANMTAPLAGFARETAYSENSLCRKQYCVNPVFPGINDLPRLEALQWQCATQSLVQEHMDFCKNAVIYDPALPSPIKKATAVSDLVKAQDDAAMTMFVYHLNGMGFDAWDYRNPQESDSECVRSIWKMTCFTYFPRAEAGCKTGQQSMYKRPCKSCCHNYIKQCGVECCDESVQCVFAHTSYTAEGKLELLQTGYIDQAGPSASCTGSARRSMSSPLLLLLGVFGLHWAASGNRASAQDEGDKAVPGPRMFGRCMWLGLLGIFALSLQGCDMQIPTHKVGNWRAKPSYLNEYKYLPPGKNANAAVLNSCSLTSLPATQQCSGRGFCKSFSTSSAAAQQRQPLAFCSCDRDWADPECGTKRKSQMTAFFWSLFLGFTGADYFYLGFPLWGLGKLFTLGGCGFWWLTDIVRTGSGPVYAYDFRTAADLPHWVAVLVMIFVCMLAGFAVAIETYLTYRRQKRDDVARLQNSEESRHFKNTKEELKGLEGPRFRVKHPLPPYDSRPGFSGYGAAMPLPLPNANTPFATYGPNNGMPPYAGPFGPAGIAGQGSPTPASIGVAPTYMANLGREGMMRRIDDNEGNVSIPRA